MDMNGEIYLSQLTPFDDEKKMKDFFRYSGSLVVPPCEEKVQWTVFEHPIYLKSDTVSTCNTPHFSGKTKKCLENLLHSGSSCLFKTCPKKFLLKTKVNP